MCRGHEPIALRVAHGRNLRIREHRGWDRPVVGGVFVTCDVGCSYPGLVLPDMREKRDAGRISDRPDPLTCAHPIVDGDPPLRELEVELFETETIHVRPPARRYEQPLRLDHLSRSEKDAYTRVNGFDSVGTVPHSHVDAFLAEPLPEELSRLGIDSREKVIRRLDDRRLRAHPVEELRELDADRPTSENDDALGHSIRPDGLAVRPVVDIVQAVDGRHGR